MRREIPIFIDSGAPGATTNNNSTTIYISPTLVFPKQHHVTFVAVNASMWYVTPNVSIALGNNTWTFTIGATTTTYVFPDGLYSLSDIQEALSNFLVNDGFSATLFIVGGIESTGNTTITINGTGVSINFATNTIGGTGLLGFTTNIVSNATSGTVYLSDQTATFNKIESFLFHLSICNGSVYNGRSSTDVVLKAIPDVSAGSQIRLEPNNLFSCTVLQREVDRVTLYITDQDGNSVDLRGESFSIMGYIQIED